jgi:hypothetical protein
MASRSTPVSGLAAMLAAEQAQVTDGMKLRGRYADMDAAGNILRPDDITEAEAAGQLARAARRSRRSSSPSPLPHG